MLKRRDLCLFFMGEANVPKAEESPLIYLGDVETKRLVDRTLERFSNSALRPSEEIVYAAIKSVGYETGTKNGYFDWRIAYKPEHIVHNADLITGVPATMAFVPRRLLVLENIDKGACPIVPLSVKNAQDGFKYRKELHRIFGSDKTRRGYGSETFVKNMLENKGLVRVLKQISKTTPFALLGVFNMKTEGTWHNYPLLCVPGISDPEQRIVIMAAETGVSEYILRGHN